MERKRKEHTLEVYLAIEVSIVENLHGDLFFSSIMDFHRMIFDGDVFFNVLAG